MTTYKEIQEYIKKKYGYSVKSCWIAHVKEISNLKPRVAPNRFSVDARQNPCPQEKIDAIIDAFKHYGMI